MQLLADCVQLYPTVPICIMSYDHNERTSTLVLLKACVSYSITFYVMNGKYLLWYEPMTSSSTHFFQIPSNWQLTGDKKNSYITMIAMAMLCNFPPCTRLYFHLSLYHQIT